MDSMHDPKVGVVFDPKSLIGALTSLILDFRDSCLIDSNVNTDSTGHSL